jgi:hypothetical protein
VPLSVPPDPEAVFVGRLAAQSTLTALTPRIGTRLSGTYPAIRITLVGDSGDDGEGRRFVAFQVEFWADDDATASLMARTFESCRLDIRGSSAGGYLALTDVNSVTPGYDDTSERVRYFADVSGVITWL